MAFEYTKERNFIIATDTDTKKVVAKYDLTTNTFYGVRGTPVTTLPSAFKIPDVTIYNYRRAYNWRHQDEPYLKKCVAYLRGYVECYPLHGDMTSETAKKHMHGAECLISLGLPLYRDDIIDVGNDAVKLTADVVKTVKEFREKYKEALEPYHSIRQILSAVNHDKIALEMLNKYCGTHDKDMHLTDTHPFRTNAGYYCVRNAILNDVSNWSCDSPQFKHRDKWISFYSRFISRFEEETLLSDSEIHWVTGQISPRMFIVNYLKMWREYSDLHESDEKYYSSFPEIPRNVLSSAHKLAQDWEAHKKEYNNKELASYNDIPALHFTYGDYIIVPLVTAEQFHEEAEAQHNCVERNYLPYCIAHRTHIVSVRHKDNPTLPVVTCEVTNEGEINQFLTRFNHWVYENDPLYALRIAYQAHLNKNFPR